MTPKQPNSKRNLDQAIRRLAKNQSVEQRIRLIIANTIIGQMLPSGVVKGGSALKLRYGNDATRFTRDLDADQGADLDGFISSLEKRLENGWNNFTGSVVRREPAKPEGVPKQYVMQPFEIKLAYNQKSWITIPLEIGHNELGDADEPEYGISDDIVEMFLALGFPAPNPIPLMPLRYQIAQKLHGASEEGSDRAHDLIDLQIMASGSEIEYQKVKKTCERLFAYREQQAWPPVITKNEDWDTLYADQIEGLSVIDGVDDAIVWANNLIDRIDSAVR